MQKVLGSIRKAVQTYNLIEDGDSVAVAVSGGKDSLVMLQGLKEFQRFAGIDYRLTALTIDPRFNGEDGDYSAVERLCEKLEIPYVIERTDIAAVVFDIRKEKNPCRKTFQAIRIEVNRELEVLEKGIDTGFKMLSSGGRMAIITFHSLEDRIVKNAFREYCTGCTCPPDFPVCVCGKTPRARLVNKKPITAAESELEENPRSRSAKLRILEKL